MSVSPTDRGSNTTSEFESLLATIAAPLRRALLASYGPVVADDIYADTVAWAWEHQDRLAKMTNPGGYLYRVSQSAARRYRHRTLAWFESSAPPVSVDPDLLVALTKLTARQRAAVILVHGHGESLAAAAAELGCSVSSLRNHLARGLARLRTLIGDVDETQ